MSSETTIAEKSSETVGTKPEVAKKGTVSVEPQFEKSLAEKITSKLGWMPQYPDLRDIVHSAWQWEKLLSQWI